MISIDQLQKKFGKFVALNDISLQLHQRQTVALIGPNGSGKTTLLKCMLEMVIPDKGQILFNGVNIHSNSEYRSKIGYMPQIGRFPDNMTIAQVFEMMKDIRKDAESLDEELIKSFGLDQIMDKRMRTLSGGTRQKVGASLAFMFKPEVLILDEPTAGLDPLSSEILKSKIQKERDQGKLVLITSHVLSDLDDLITDVLYLQEGRLQFFKSLDKLKEETGEYNLTRAIAGIMRGK